MAFKPGKHTQQRAAKSHCLSRVPTEMGLHSNLACAFQLRKEGVGSPKQYATSECSTKYYDLNKITLRYTLLLLPVTEATISRRVLGAQGPRLGPSDALGET